MQTLGQSSIGISSGLTFNNSLQSSDDNLPSTLKPEIGWNIGLPITFHINDNIFFLSGLYYTQKNYSIIDKGSYSILFINSYSQIPIIICKRLIKSNAFVFNAEIGAFFSIWSYSKLKVRVPNIFDTTPSIDADGQVIENVSIVLYNKKRDFRKDIDNRIEAGLLMGSSLMLFKNENVFFLRLQLSQAITSQEKNYSINVSHKFNQTLSIEFGVLRKIRLNL